MIPRWAAPLLVVVFVLITVWAGYNLSSQLSASRAPSAPTPILSFEGSGSYYYVATLAPNDLYNSTTISGTNVTLFAPVTRWINVTFVDGVTLDSPASTQLVDHFTVTLSTPAWSKTLDHAVQTNASANSTSLAIVDRYGLNVSWVENLSQTIDKELGYSPPQFTVTLTPVVTGDISIGSEEAPVSMSPFLNLTFAASLITLKGLPTNSEGGINSGPSDSANGGAVTDAYVFLAASLGALAVSIGLLWATWRGTKSSALPDLDTLIEPYEEVIVGTTKTPEVSTILPVERWDDLVKVADTLGRPILRPFEGPNEPQGSSFYVVDGSVAYEYQYRSTSAHQEEKTTPAREPTEGALNSPAEPGAAIAARFEPAMSPATPTPISSTIAENLKWGAADQLKADIARIQSAKLSPTERARALELVRETARLVRSAKPSETQRILDEFHRALDDLVHEPPSSQ